MASEKEGAAHADRTRAKYSKFERQTQRAMDSLPPYRAEEDSEAEITGSWKGIHAKGNFPRAGRLAIAFALAGLILAAAIVAVLKAWPR